MGRQRQIVRRTARPVARRAWRWVTLPQACQGLPHMHTQHRTPNARFPTPCAPLRSIEMQHTAPQPDPCAHALTGDDDEPPLVLQLQAPPLVIVHAVQRWQNLVLDGRHHCSTREGCRGGRGGGRHPNMGAPAAAAAAIKVQQQIRCRGGRNGERVRDGGQGTAGGLATCARTRVVPPPRTVVQPCRTPVPLMSCAASSSCAMACVAVSPTNLLIVSMGSARPAGGMGSACGCGRTPGPCMRRHGAHLEGSMMWLPAASLKAACCCTTGAQRVASAAWSLPADDDAAARTDQAPNHRDAVHGVDHRLQRALHVPQRVRQRAQAACQAAQGSFQVHDLVGGGWGTVQDKDGPAKSRGTVCLGCCHAPTAPAA